MQQGSDLVNGVPVVQDRKRSVGVLTIDHLTNFADGEWDKLVLRMTSGLSSTNTQHSSVRTFFKQMCSWNEKKGGGVGPHFKHEPENHFMLVDTILACDETLFSQ